MFRKRSLSVLLAAVVLVSGAASTTVALATESVGEAAPTVAMRKEDDKKCKKCLILDDRRPELPETGHELELHGA